MLRYCSQAITSLISRTTLSSNGSRRANLNGKDRKMIYDCDDNHDYDHVVTVDDDDDGGDDDDDDGSNFFLDF